MQSVDFNNIVLMNIMNMFGRGKISVSFAREAIIKMSEIMSGGEGKEGQRDALLGTDRYDAP